MLFPSFLVSMSVNLKKHGQKAFLVLNPTTVPEHMTLKIYQSSLQGASIKCAEIRRNACWENHQTAMQAPTSVKERGKEDKGKSCVV